MSINQLKDHLSFFSWSPKKFLLLHFLFTNKRQIKKIFKKLKITWTVTPNDLTVKAIDFQPQGILTHNCENSLCTAIFLSTNANVEATQDIIITFTFSDDQVSDPVTFTVTVSDSKPTIELNATSTTWPIEEELKIK